MLMIIYANEHLYVATWSNMKNFYVELKIQWDSVISNTAQDASCHKRVM